MADRKESREESLRSIQFLEGQTHYPDQRMVNDQLVEEMQLLPGEVWLEVGSGSGALCRQAAPHLFPGGCVVGLDASPFYLSEAARYAAAAGGMAGICLLAGGGENIPFASATFDGVFAARLLLNVSNPDAILQEMMRVARVGARILLLDWDFDTFTVHSSQVELTRYILRWRADHYSSNSWSGRQLYSRMRKAGLQDIKVRPVVSYGLDNQSAIYNALSRAALACLNGGGISTQQYRSWMDELEEKAEAGDFFASLNYYIVAGRK